MFDWSPEEISALGALTPWVKRDIVSKLLIERQEMQEELSFYERRVGELEVELRLALRALQEARGETGGDAPNDGDSDGEATGGD